ncbi:VWA domain-containing protein [Streptomyces sp. NPDC088261]|uniref:VWA domain-containing protein n=1 Tax=Streptomyces sp. NPDC088261 TaxID=3365851 RepID=UPI0038281BEC
MTNLAKGANVPLPTTELRATLTWRPGPGVPDVDASALVLDGRRRVRGDDDLVFYNQPVHPSGAVVSGPGRPGEECLRLDLGRVPAGVASVVLAASADGGPFGRVPGLRLQVTDAGTGAMVVAFDIGDATTDTAFVFGEVYRRAGGWRFRAVGQGYASGLAGLATDFGVAVADDPPPPGPGAPGRAVSSQSATTPPAPSSPSPLKKQRLISMEKRLAEDGHDALLSYTRKAAVSLETHGLADHTARVALCLDMSASMSGLYESGRVQALAERVLALALRWDDNGEVDVFPFAAVAEEAGSMGLADYRGRTVALHQEAGVGGSTDYGEAIRRVRGRYLGSEDLRSLPPLADAGAGEGEGAVGPPVFVVVVTDGATSEPEVALEQLRSSRYEPVFWQFMAIGEAEEFAFLAELSARPGPYLDNLGFFSVRDPRELTDDQLYDLLLARYPRWLDAARGRGLRP